MLTIPLWVVPAAAQPAVGPVELVARWSPGGERVEEPIFWRVFDARRGPLGERPLRFSAFEPAPRAELGSGRYLVNAVIGETSVEREVDVAIPAREPVELVLDAGRMALSARHVADGPALSHNLRWRVYASPEDAQAARNPVATSFASTSEFVLPARRYWVVGIDGNARAQVEAEVLAGQRTSASLVLEAGELELRAVLARDTPPIRQDLRWEVHRLDSDGAEHLVTSEFAAVPIVRLPVGRYRIRVRFGSAERAREVRVRAGTREELSLDLEAGLLRVWASLAPGGEPPALPVRWRVYASSGGDDEVLADELRETTVFPLAAGRYRVRASVGLVERSAETHVRAGRVEDLELDLAAARIEVEGVLAATGEPAEGPLLWQLFDEGGERPRDTLEAELAVFVVPAGRYRLLASGRDGRGERVFEARAGSRRRLQLPLAP